MCRDQFDQLLRHATKYRALLLKQRAVEVYVRSRASSLYLHSFPKLTCQCLATHAKVMMKAFT